MADMLGVSTFQVRDPILLLVLMKTDDFSIHIYSV
jgi:hypothetical protein